MLPSLPAVRPPLTLVADASWLPPASILVLLAPATAASLPSPRSRPTVRARVSLEPSSWWSTRVSLAATPFWLSATALRCCVERTLPSSSSVVVVSRSWVRLSWVRRVPTS